MAGNDVSRETHLEVIAKGIKEIENATWLSGTDVSPLQCRWKDHINTETYRPVMSPVQIKRLEALLNKYTGLISSIVGKDAAQSQVARSSRTPKSQLRRRQSLKISKELLFVADLAKTPTRLRVQETPKSRRRSSIGETNRGTPAVKLFESPVKPHLYPAATNQPYTDTTTLLSLLERTMASYTDIFPCSLLDSDFLKEDDKCVLLSMDDVDFKSCNPQSELRPAETNACKLVGSKWHDQQCADENNPNLYSNDSNSILTTRGSTFSTVAMLTDLEIFIDPSADDDLIKTISKRLLYH